MTVFAEELLKKHYCREGETIEQAFIRACNCFGTNQEHSNRLQEYLKKEWFMFSSPILSNAINGVFDNNRFIYMEQPKGLPISCFLGYVDDSIAGLCEHTTETRWLSVKGGGVGGHWSDVRSISDITPGALGFLHTIDADMVAYRQGKTRRGSYGAYLNIDHPEIIEFIKMRVPTGDLNRKNLNLHHGVNITDDFLEAVDKDLDWCLVDPHTCQVTDKVKARDLWEELLTTRYRTGEPYINYIDEANDKLHPALKTKGLRINGSNLCNEIHLPTDNDRTAVCCLSSVNLVTYDEWKQDPYFISDLIEMLDNVLTYFINFAPKELHKAIRSASGERSLGLGAMGFTDYLQSLQIPYESAMAISINKGIFKNIKDNALKATKALAITRGEAKDAIGYGVRNTHLLAIAPNANSSIILGVSPSIEPRASNCYTHKTRVGSYLVKNKNLEKLINSIKPSDEQLTIKTIVEEKSYLKVTGIKKLFYKILGKPTEIVKISSVVNTNKLTKEKWIDNVWESILENNGSVQHLECLTDDEKKIFKTSFELNQEWVVEHARARQEYICQGQSVNLFFEAGADKEYVNRVHRRAFTTNGIGVPLKGLYYLRTESSRKTEKVNIKIERDKLQDGVQGSIDTCIACHG